MAVFGFLKTNDTRKAVDIPEEERDYYLERRYPAFGNLVPRDVASRAAKERCDAGYGVGTSKQAVYLDYADAIERYGKIEAGKEGRSDVPQEEIIAMGKAVVKSKYGNLFDMYEKLPEKTLMNFLCVFTLQCIIQWADYG